MSKEHGVEAPRAEPTIDAPVLPTIAPEGTGAYTPGSTQVDATQPAGSAAFDDSPRDPHRYRIGEEIARGGMGSVHRAVDVAFDREVAIKFLRPDLASELAAVRFFEEARITGQLQHPNIPPVHDVGTMADGRPFLAMKLIRGRTFHDLLQDRQGLGELDRDLRIFEQIGLAVAYAHSRGIIHRDLKPANVMVGTFGEVQVMDWGLAKRSGARDVLLPDGVAGSPDETRPGTVLGTLAFMPPEQAQGQLDRVDSRSDVFALGAILAMILTGKPIYQAKTTEDLWRMASVGDLERAIERLDRIKSAVSLQRVVALAKRCLSSRPDDRPSHAGEVCAALATVRESSEGLKQSEAFRAAVDEYVAEIDKYKASEREVNRRSRGAAITLVVSLAAIAAVGIYAWRQDGELNGQRALVARTSRSLARVIVEERDPKKLREAADALRGGVDSLTVVDAVPAYLDLAGCYDSLEQPAEAFACWTRAASLINRSDRTTAGDIPPGSGHPRQAPHMAIHAIKRCLNRPVSSRIDRFVLRRALTEYDQSKQYLNADSLSNAASDVESARKLLAELESRKP